MKKLSILSTVLFSQLIAFKSYGLVCPETSKAKACPTSGSTLLDETYPTQAFVISNQPFFESAESNQLSQKFIQKIATSYDFENIPQIIVPIGTKDEFNKIVADVKANLEKQKIPRDKIKKTLDQISWVEMSNYLWQQDWFESFVNLKTGRPEIRQLASYDRMPHDAYITFTEEANQCQIAPGKPIPDRIGDHSNMKEIKAQDLSFVSGEMGGNIEGAPAGFCMVGDNLAKAHSNDFCGKAENVITLQTSWLEVGHTDEIFKIIPTQYNDGRPKECEFTLMSASPKKALELMQHPQKGQSSFVNFDLSASHNEQVQKRLSRTHESFSPNAQICLYIHNAVINNPKSFRSLPAKTRSVFLKVLFGDEAQAQNAVTFRKRSSFNPEDITNNCHNNIDQVTNFQMQQLMKANSDFVNLNNAIEESIQNDKKLIKSKILSRLPQCQNYYDELDVPNLFYGQGTYKTADGKRHLNKPGNVGSFLPNPTNSVLMNKTLVVPDSENSLFNNYLAEELKRRKMKTDFIPTWDYAHLGHGNLHCATHSIPYCRPN